MKELKNSPDFEFVTNIENVQFSVLVIKYPLTYNDDGDDNLSKAIHHHNYYEIVYVNKGTATFISENNEEILNENDLIIISPNTNHKVLNIEECDAYKIGFTINETLKQNSTNNLSNQLLHMFKQLTYKIFNSSYEIKYIFNLANFSIDLWKENYWQSLFSLLIYTLYGYMVQSHFLINVEKKNKINTIDAINNALIYHFTSDITIDELAKKVFLCPRQINRICNKLYGTSFSQQKTIFRIDYAKKLIKENKYSIPQISELVGYNSVSTFYAAFIKQCNMTPKEYKEKNPI